jgi:hypothetical protein
VVDELVVEYWSGSGWLPLSGPIFDETNFLPGEGVTRLIRVTNNRSTPQRIATEAIKYPNPIPTSDLSRALTIVIKEDATDLYGGSSPTGPKYLYDFYQDSENYPEISLSNLANGATTQYDFTISFPPEKENEWQGATTTFDIVIGFQGDLPPAPLSPMSILGGSRGGSMRLLIYDEMVVSVGMNNVIISWQTNLSANSRIIYSAAYQPHLFNSENPPNYGYANSTIINPAQVTSRIVSIGGLSPATTYFFRCVSHTASDKAISGELSFTTLGVAGAAEEIVPLLPEAPSLGKEDGIEPEVEGESIEEEITIGEDKDLDKFLATAGACMAAGNLCWLFFAVIIILTVLYLLSRDKKEKEIKKKDLIFLLIIILLIILYCIFCCSYCWILILVISLLFILFTVLNIYLTKSKSV